MHSATGVPAEFAAFLGANHAPAALTSTLSIRAYASWQRQPTHSAVGPRAEREPPHFASRVGFRKLQRCDRRRYWSHRGLGLANG